MQPQPMHGGQPAPSTPTTGLPVCPICATPRTGRYCEECGYDWELAAQQQPRAAAPAPAQPMSPPVSQPMAQPMSPPPPAGGYTGYVTGDTSGGNTEYMIAPPSPLPGSNVGMDPDPFQQLGTGGGGYAQADPYGQQQSYGQQSYGQQQPYGQQPQPPAPAYRGTWIAVVSADRGYFQDMMTRSGPEAAGLYFPPYSPERRVPMTGQGQLRIGRRSHQRGTVPEIDLSIAPEDPGASHNHALLQEQPDGSWVVIDQDSTNGTTLNGAEDPLPKFVPVELKDGDRIHVGAWTTITVHCA
jgi:pSer/pThr/pTyr-binding forkhead associated (FHA) protein